MNWAQDCKVEPPIADEFILWQFGPQEWIVGGEMVTIETLQKAIAAHTSWKARLRNAISTGKFEVELSTVRVDDKCDFGKWLYGPELQPGEKQSQHYCTVKKLHAEFHQEAARIVGWALAGQKGKAEESLALGGAYTNASHRLTEAMMQWRMSLQ